MTRPESPLFWILDAAGDPVAATVEEWSKWRENPEAHRVARDELPGGILVSTIFTGLDGGWEPGLEPELWETAVFGPGGLRQMVRARSRVEAIRNHRRLLLEVQPCA